MASGSRETYYADMSTDASTVFLSDLHETRKAAQADSRRWRADTVKHLVILHAAGLAAASSIFASTTSETLRSGSVGAARVCGASLALLILLMGCYWVANAADSRRMERFIGNFIINRKPLESKPRLTLVELVDTCLAACGALSLVFFVLALVLAFPVFRSAQAPAMDAEPVIVYCFRMPDDPPQGPQETVRCDGTTRQLNALLSAHNVK